jgi:D-alanyl-D-alanine carboxypeptidase
MNMKKIIIGIIFILAIQSAKTQSFNPQLATMLQDTLNTYVSMITNIKGMSASVYIPGQGMWQGSTGVSYTGQPITNDMEFGIASNTKLFVSTAMLMLAEDGIISLNDSLHKWLPNYSNINPNITIRQLLNHTSGVSDPIFVSPWVDTIMKYPTRVFTPVEVLGWVGAPTFAAGTSWGYSNVNYILAGMIAKNATGYHISKIIRDSILSPLNLVNTFYDVEEAEVGTITHRWWDNVDFNDTSRVGLNTAGGCAGAIFSNSSDMALWYHALFSGQILNQTSMNELTTFVETSNPTYDYSLGLSRETTQGYTYWGHGGDTWGYRSKMIVDTCMGAVVCGLTNCFPSGMSAVTFLLYRVVKNHVPGCSGAITGTTTVCQGENSVTYTVPPIANATSYTWILPSGATGISNINVITIDYGLTAVSGNLIVRGVNNFGAGGNSTLYINVNPIPITPVISQNVDILNSSSTTGNQWYNSTGLINGEINQNYTVTSTNDYYTIVTLNGCISDTSNIIHVVINSINDDNANSAIAIYPNPVSDELIIEMEGNNNKMNFEIVNTMGQVVFKGNIIEKTMVNTSNFSPGIYYINLQNMPAGYATGNVFEFKKVIKK